MGKSSESFPNLPSKTVGGATKNLNGTQASPLLNSGSSTSIQKVVKIFLDTPVGTYTVQACADSPRRRRVGDQ